MSWNGLLLVLVLCFATAAAPAARTPPQARDTIRSFHGERHGCIKGAHPRGVLRAKVILAANVMEIRSFAALKKSSGGFARRQSSRRFCRIKKEDRHAQKNLLASAGLDRLRAARMAGAGARSTTAKSG